MMDEQTRELVELVKAGLGAKEAAEVMKAKRLLANGHAAKQMLLPANIEEQPTLPPAPPPPPTDPPPSPPIPITASMRDRRKSVKNIVDELIVHEDVETAPAGTIWQIPLARVSVAQLHSKHGDGYRTHAQCRGAVNNVFAHRGQQNMVSVSCTETSSVITVRRL